MHILCLPNTKNPSFKCHQNGDCDDVNDDGLGDEYGHYFKGGDNGNDDVNGDDVSDDFSIGDSDNKGDDDFIVIVMMTMG